MTNPGEFNPYSAPNADLDLGVQTHTAGGPLASPWSRLGAALIDGLLYLAASIPAMGVAGFAGLASLGRAGGTLGMYVQLFTSGPLGLLSALALLAILGYQIYLLTKTGQTIGKRMSKIKIVKLDGANPGFVHAVVLRSWIGVVIGAIPLLGGIYGLVDILFIFRGDRRCIHDHIAGTRVVNV